MKTFFHFAILLLFFVSCDKNTDYGFNPIQRSSDDFNSNYYDYNIAESVTAGNMIVNITTSAKSVVTVITKKVNVNYLNDDTFTVVTNPGTFNQQSYTATAASITEPDSTLKVVKNPGLYQTVYNSKYTCTITANATSQLIVNVQPGNISTNALSIVGDEDEGF